MLCAAVPPLDGLGCSGVALKNSIWRYATSLAAVQ
jgi:hypothetical protein